MKRPLESALRVAVWRDINIDPPSETSTLRMEPLLSMTRIVCDMEGRRGDRGARFLSPQPMWPHRKFKFKFKFKFKLN